jgi:glycosyl transferase family 25
LIRRVTCIFVPRALSLRLWLWMIARGGRWRWIARGDFLFSGQRPSARLLLHLRSRYGRPTRPFGIERLPAIMFINLERRADRLEAFTREASRLQLNRIDRFEAIDDPNGALGCSLSHAGCLRRMIERGWEAVMICEDDVVFTLDRDELDVLVDAFLADERAEVACFAHYHQRVVPHSALFLRALSTQTMACYLVKSTIAQDLLAVIEDGIEGLRSGGSPLVYCCDMVWKQLQTSRVFVVPIVRAARQAPGFSDLENKIMVRTV